MHNKLHLEILSKLYKPLEDPKVNLKFLEFHIKFSIGYPKYNKGRVSIVNINNLFAMIFASKFFWKLT